MTDESSHTPTTTLAAVTATVKYLQNTANSAGAQGHALLVTPGITDGRESAYEPHTSEDDPLPPVAERVQHRAMEVVQAIMDAFGRQLDGAATRDWGNCQPDARADVVLGDGTVLLRDVPTAVLLMLEKQLSMWRTLLEKIPTLNAQEKWEWDKERKLWRSEPRQVPRTVEVPYGSVLYEATPEHPAQVSQYLVSEMVGVWTHVAYSGAIPAKELGEILSRLDDLAVAIKLAREKANATRIPKRNISDRLLGYILSGDTPKASQPDSGGESQ